MHDVLLFFTKLGLYVGAAVGAVAYMPVPEVELTGSIRIASIQVVLACLVYLLFTVCQIIVSAIHSREQYDAVDVALAELDTETVSVPEIGSPCEVDAVPVEFGSMEDVNRHVLMVHCAGLLIWNTVISMDYTQPDLCYCFTVGLVTAWLCKALIAGCQPRQTIHCRETLQVFIYMMCVTMLASVNMIDARISQDNILSILTGFAWPCFFTRNASSVSRRPGMVLHTIKSSFVTCVLLCFCPLLAWEAVPISYSQHTLIMLFVVQPIIKFMCIAILCISIQTGHKKDLVIVLSVASCSQFLFLYPLDRTYQIFSVLTISMLLSIHVFGMCYSRRPTQ